MQVLKFTENPNKKLNCNYFVHFTKHDRFSKDEQIIITLGFEFKICKIVESKKIHISKLTDSHCYLSNGKNLQLSLNHIGNYYDLDILSKDAFIYYVLFESFDNWKKYDSEQMLFD